MNRTRVLTTALLVTAALVWARPAAAQGSAYELLQTFSSVVAQVRQFYVDSVTTQRLVSGAIRGLLASLDPHSHFVAHDDALRLFAYESGRLAAIGIGVETVGGATTVVGVHPRSPAARAGVLPGDRILALNDTSVAGLDAPSLQARLLGEAGASVRLRLERGPRHDPDSVTLRLRYETLAPVSVSAARTLAGGVGYVRLEGFHPETSREIRDAIGRTVRGGHPQLILDLRGNGGGLAEAAVDVAALFLRAGQIVYTSRGRRRDATTEIRAERDGEFRDVALVVLIDGATASASEVVAGALQDHDRAVVAGRLSFGKALLQRVFEVPPLGDAVWLTVAYLHTPSGRLIQRRYEGLTLAQYAAQAGTAGTTRDTLAEFHTDAGRIVRGGGGIRPDTVLAAPPDPPAWWLAAVDSGFLTAVADSVARTLSPTPSARTEWIANPADWQARLARPVLDRVRIRLGVRSEPDAAQVSWMALLLAARVAEVRWGTAAEVDLRLRHDPDIAAAVALVGRATALLARRQ